MRTTLSIAVALLALSLPLSAQRTAPIPPRQQSPYQSYRAGRAWNPHYGNIRLYTSYDPYSNIGGGAVTDSTWYRQPIADAIDNYYIQAAPNIPESLLPPKAKEGQPNPFDDRTKSIFTSSSASRGMGAEIGNASSEMEVLAIELFGFSDRIPRDIVEPIRTCVAREASARGRNYVLDAQCLLGRPYDGQPVYYGGDSGYFRFTERMSELYCKGVRYVLSGAVVGYFTHEYYASPDAKKPTYETMITMLLTIYDLDTATILETYWTNLVGKGSRQMQADQNAISHLENSLKNFFNDNIKITSTIRELGEFDKKGRAKECIINSGLEIGVRHPDLFQVFRKNIDGSYKKIGRLRVKNSSNGSSYCAIAAGREDVQAAFEDGNRIVLLSSGEALF